MSVFPHMHLLGKDLICYAVTPANDTINPSQDVLIQFNEPIRLINNTNVDNTNIQSLFTLAYADTGTSSIDFVASVDDDDQQFTLNPDVSLDERRTIEVTYAADVFEDFGKHDSNKPDIKVLKNGEFIFNVEVKIFSFFETD